MDKAEHLSKLKSLKIERGNGALFASSEDCMHWIDNVLPLLKYDQQHYVDFYNHSQYVRLTSLSATTLMSHLEPMIGIVHQAITELENNIESPQTLADNVVPSQSASTTPHHWYQRPIGKIGLTVIGGVLVILVVYLIKQHLGLAL
jgi:hypothetical protein